MASSGSDLRTAQDGKKLIMLITYYLFQCIFVFLTQHNNVSDALAGTRRVREHQLVLSTVRSGGLPDVQDCVLLVLVYGNAVAVVRYCLDSQERVRGLQVCMFGLDRNLIDSFLRLIVKSTARKPINFCCSHP